MDTGPRRFARGALHSSPGFLRAFTGRHSLTLLGLAMFVGALAFVLTINDFLAISRPVDGNILVVEGWIWNSPAIIEAAEEFNRGRYERLVTVGSTVQGNEETPDRESSAVLAARRLRELGVDEPLIVVLLVPSMSLHRTYASALALKDWFAMSKTEPRGVNVFTLGAHARKSLVLFKRALGPTINVGVIAGTEDTFDPKRWWMSPTGVYVIARKTLGYLYAVLWPLPENLSVSANSPKKRGG